MWLFPGWAEVAELPRILACPETGAVISHCLLFFDKVAIGRESGLPDEWPVLCTLHPGAVLRECSLPCWSRMSWVENTPTLSAQEPGGFQPSLDPRICLR